MADYHPLMFRAVAQVSTAAQRRALYERARDALVRQLRAIEPALPERDITGERLALEDAIRKVESEMVRRSSAERPPVPQPPQPQFIDDNQSKTVLKSGNVGGMDYTLYSDGSILAALPQGTLLFESIAALREHIGGGFEQTPGRATAQHEEGVRRLKAEEEARFREQELERQREEEAKRLKAQEEAIQQELERQREEEVKRLKAEEEARRRDRELQRQQKEEADRLKLEEQDKRREKARVSTVVREKLAEVASPAPSLSKNGLLDAGPNVDYDVPTSDDDLPTLPLRQRALIKTIFSGLPKNAPPSLKAALNNYDDELKVRGVQPILGLLKEMAAIIEADTCAEGADRDWLAEGTRKAFNLLAENHATFIKHFPLDPRREELYANTLVDEDNATGAALSKPFKEVAQATLEANRAKLTTDDFLRIIDKMAEFAVIISTQRPPMSSAGEAKLEDKAPSGELRVSPKKRVLLSGLGFFERAYNLLANTAQLASPPEGNMLLTTLRHAIELLSKLIGW